MFNRSEIIRAAWASYRSTAALIGLTKFSRKHFAHALRMAWYDAKLIARIEAQMAEEAAEALANPSAAEARDERTFLNMKDQWTSDEYSRAASLHAFAA